MQNMGPDMIETVNCDRLNRRVTVLLHGRCRQSSWKVFDVELDNISEGGCCIIGGGEHFEPMQGVSLRFANLRNVDAQVRWIRGDKVGIEFRAPLKHRLIEAVDHTYGISIEAEIGTASVSTDA